MKPNDICADVLNPDSLLTFLRVGGAFPVFLFGGEGRRDLALGHWIVPPHHPQFSLQGCWEEEECIIPVRESF